MLKVTSFLSVLLWSWVSLATPERVIVISIDGAAPWVMAKTKLPNLENIMAQGSFSRTAQTIYPSITLPSHTSMVTGVGPEVHGILWNDWHPEKGLVKVPTMFGAAKAFGLKTALICGKPKFKHLVVPNTIDLFFLVNSADKKVADKALEVIQTERPQLTMIHFRDVDYNGHMFGWGSSQQKKALETVDGLIGRLITMLEQTGMMKSTTIIITADHGGHDNTHGSNRPEDMNIPWIAFGKGATLGLLKRDIRTMDTAATALWLLGVPSPSSFQGKPVTEGFKF